MRVGKKEPQPGVTLATDREEDESRVDPEEVNRDEGFSRSKKIKKTSFPQPRTSGSEPSSPSAWRMREFSTAVSKSGRPTSVSK